MKRILLGLMATGAAAVLTLSAASTASAGTADGAAASSGPGIAQPTCTAVADENRSVWAEPGTGGGTVGSVTAGSVYSAACELVEGETYTACGSTTSQWAYIGYATNEWGYVPSTCVTWAS